MKLKLYNTESREKEEIIPLDGETIRMYTCGPTVYNYAHIGNFRTYVFEDLLRRTLLFFGMKIYQVMNITDVEDKIIKNVIAQNIALEDFTKPYTQAFFEDLKVLGIQAAEAYPAATDYIPDMIAIIQKLLGEGIAYRGKDQSIYYSIRHFPSYGRLSHLCLDELKAASSDKDEYDKEQISDFALWKAYDAERDGSVFWESPFGPGRPGWHIECSAMAMKLLGESIDIHVGGVDNMFPHHENEIAQSEAFSGKQFVKHWLHAEHLLVDHRKMSKSLGNFFTLRDLLNRGFSGPQIRYLLLQTHYRTQLNFTFQGLESAKHTLTRLADFIARLRSIKSAVRGEKVSPLLKAAAMAFQAALADDLNISAALGVLFDVVRDVNTLCDQNGVAEVEAQEVLVFLAECDQVLGVIPLEETELPLSDVLQDALEKRQQARAEKNWKLADYWRDMILEKGYIIDDTPQGPRLKQK